MARLLALITRSSHAFVIALSVVGVTASIFILLWPEAGDRLADRANISSAVATVVALFAAFFAVTAALWVTTTEYRAEQAAKEDTARVRATLQSMKEKAERLSATKANPGQEPDTFKAEREALNEFVLSTTAFAYRRWVLARAAGSERAAIMIDPWQLFFLQTANLIGACQPPADVDSTVKLARQLQATLDTLRPNDLRRISSLAGDLTGEFRFPTAAETAQQVLDEKLRAIRTAAIADALREVDEHSDRRDDDER